MGPGWYCGAATASAASDRAAPRGPTREMLPERVDALLSQVGLRPAAEDNRVVGDVAVAVGHAGVEQAATLGRLGDQRDGVRRGVVDGGGPHRSGQTLVQVQDPARATAWLAKNRPFTLRSNVAS